jgi:hypothetical protein
MPIAELATVPMWYDERGNGWYDERGNGEPLVMLHPGGAGVDSRSSLARHTASWPKSRTCVTRSSPTS